MEWRQSVGADLSLDITIQASFKAKDKGLLFAPYSMARKITDPRSNHVVHMAFIVRDAKQLVHTHNESQKGDREKENKARFVFLHQKLTSVWNETSTFFCFVVATA